jgi:hypothetical protein
MISRVKDKKTIGGFYANKSNATNTLGQWDKYHAWYLVVDLSLPFELWRSGGGRLEPCRCRADHRSVRSGQGVRGLCPAGLELGQCGGWDLAHPISIFIGLFHGSRGALEQSDHRRVGRDNGLEQRGGHR